MQLKRILRTFIILMVLSSNIGCDQISKHIVRQRLEYNQEIGLIDNYLTLTKIENAGAFLSLGHTLPKPVKMLLLTILPMCLLGFAIFYLMTKMNLTHVTMLGISFIVGGGVGNIYDRLIYGSVTDFLQINFVVFQTGIFNMADVSIMTGICMIGFDACFNWAKLNRIALDKNVDQ